MLQTIYDQSIFILHNTNDGNQLSNLHLKLVEIAANGDLSESGKTAFNELYENVKSGYTKN